MQLPNILKPSERKILNLLSISAYLLIGILILFALFLFSLKNLTTIFVGIGVVATAIWLLYAPSNGFPPKPFIVDKETFPVLNNLVAAVSAEIGVPSIPIMLTENGGCTLGLIGIPQRPVLIMGQSLLVLMPFDETVAVIAHEAGHLRDNSFSRSPVHVVARGIAFRLIRLANMLHLHPLAQLVEKWRRLNWNIQIADGLQSEFVADSWSVLIGGTVATSRTLTRFANFWQNSSQVEPRTHPSCAARLEAVNNLPFTEPIIQYTDEQRAELLMELHRWPQVMKERTDALFATEKVNVSMHHI